MSSVLSDFLKDCDTQFTTTLNQVSTEDATAQEQAQESLQAAVAWLTPLLPEAVVPFTNFDLPAFGEGRKQDKFTFWSGTTAVVLITLPDCAPVVSNVLQPDLSHPPLLRGASQQTMWSVALYFPKDKPASPDDVRLGFESFDSLEFAVGYAHQVGATLPEALAKTQINFDLRHAERALFEARFPSNEVLADSLQEAQALAAEYRFEESQSISLTVIGHALLHLLHVQSKRA